VARVIGKRLDKSGQWVDVYGDDEDERLEEYSSESETEEPDDLPLNKEAEKEFKAKERDLLIGELEIVPDLALRSAKTIRLEGFGRILSGLYFVESVTTEFNLSSGMDYQKISVSRDGFGEYMKKGKTLQKLPEPKAEGRKEELQPPMQPS
jgi:hypothetical protein